MPDKKLTDNEIVNALEEWIKNYDGSYVNFKMLGNALDLINRLQADKEYYKKNRDKYQDNVMFLSKQCDELQAENERLQKAIKVQELMLENQDYTIKRAKAEAYKEFAERLKENFKPLNSTLIENRIDNLLKELESGKQCLNT